MKKIINLGIRDYVADLYKDGEISIRVAAEIMQLPADYGGPGE